MPALLIPIGARPNPGCLSIPQSCSGWACPAFRTPSFPMLFRPYHSLVPSASGPIFALRWWCGEIVGPETEARDPSLRDSFPTEFVGVNEAIPSSTHLSCMVPGSIESVQLQDGQAQGTVPTDALFENCPSELVSQCNYQAYIAVRLSLFLKARLSPST